MKLISDSNKPTIQYDFILKSKLHFYILGLNNPESKLRKFLLK